jgi:hypothetical protein
MFVRGMFVRGMFVRGMFVRGMFVRGMFVRGMEERNGNRHYPVYSRDHHSPIYHVSFILYHFLTLTFWLDLLPLSVISS